MNLSLFITEIVSAIVATTYKPIDTSNMVKLCVSLHQIYEEFNDHLGSNLKQALLLSISEDDTEASKRKRIQIRFIVELFQVGLFADDEFFVHLLRNLLGKLPLKGYEHVHMTCLSWMYVCLMMHHHYYMTDCKEELVYRATSRRRWTC